MGGMGSGRKPQEHPKAWVQHTVRFEAAEWTDVVGAASREGLTVAEYFRMLYRRFGRKGGPGEEKEKKS